MANHDSRACQLLQPAGVMKIPPNMRNLPTAHKHKRHCIFYQSVDTLISN